jgi:hypothetical protein
LQLENNIGSAMSVQEFIKSLERQYDIKLRSRFQNDQGQYNAKPYVNHSNNNDSSFYPEVNSLLQQQLFLLTGFTEKNTLDIPE